MTEFIPQPGCATPEPVTTLKVDQARQRILQQIKAIESWRRVALRDALGQVLHEDILSPIDVPPHANSAMDGYAIRGEDLRTGNHHFKLVGSAFAGRPLNRAFTVENASAL